MVITITIYGFIERKLDQHEGYVYPDGIQALAYLVELSPVVLVLVVSVVMLVTRGLKGELGSLFRADKWLPRDDRDTGHTGEDNKSYEN